MERFNKIINVLNFPTDIPILNEKYINDIEFNKNIHLDIHPPQYIIDLDFKEVNFPYTTNDITNFKGLAYTQPFKILSQKGIETLRIIISKNTNILKQNERNNSIRGLGYISKFVRDFSYSPNLINLFSNISNKPIALHNCYMNISQINFGKIGVNKAVDEWHTDSVDYVMVLVLSDTTDMVGGDLQVLQIADANGRTFDQLKKTNIPKHLIKNIKFPSPGYCIFMQGSLILHSVTSVVSANEPRISLINSFIDRNVFSKDNTKLSTFRDQSKDPENIANLEFARHISWRVIGQLCYIFENMNYSRDNTKDISDIFNNAIYELNKSEKIITKKNPSDLQGFIKIKSKL